jgi:acetate kinase
MRFSVIISALKNPKSREQLMEKFIITCNAGSSNIKLAKYNARTLELSEKLKVSDLAELVAWYKLQTNIAAIGHRLVHGGSEFTEAVIIDDQVIEKLSKLATLAPLHQPQELAIISALRAVAQEVKQVACFDTAFHKDLPNLEQLLPLPYAYFQEGIRRYGFHGLSYEYIASMLPTLVGAKASGKVVVAHLGNGASVCGMVNFKSLATSMGFSALDGLMMGTRCGSIDPGVILYLQQEKGLTVKEVEELLYSKSGLKGISGISNDIKVLEENGSEEAMLALKLFCYIAAKHIGSVAIATGGIDCLVFTGGIGEHSSYIRSEICSYLQWLGLSMDNLANKANAEKIDDKASAITVYVIPTDEEKIIAKRCVELVVHNA